MNNHRKHAITESRINQLYYNNDNNIILYCFLLNAGLFVFEYIKW